MHIRHLLLLVAFVIGSVNLACAQENQSKAKQKKNNPKPYPPTLEGAEVKIYKTIGDVKLGMYLYYPENHTAEDKSPAIIFFFGGGWRGGSVAQFEQQAKYFASRGMVAGIADYRVQSRHQTKAIQCVADAKSAIRWVRSNADKLGVDPQRIVASGGSAGGHIAACTAVVSGMEEAGEDTTVSSVPNALVLFNPVMALAPIDDKNILEDRMKTMIDRVGDQPVKISPYHHVKNSQPPSIIFFGTDDKLLLGAEFFATAAKQAGNRCELLTWEGERHGFFNYGRAKNKPYTETVHAADKFLASLGYLDGEPTIEIPE